MPTNNTHQQCLLHHMHRSNSYHSGLGFLNKKFHRCSNSASILGFDGQTGAPNTQFFWTGPSIRNWQMMEKFPLVNAEQVAFYEAHRDEFQSWPSKLTFLAPPQDEWRLMMNSLFQLSTHKHEFLTFLNSRTDMLLLFFVLWPRILVTLWSE